MKLSNKGRYAIQAMFDLAFHASEESAQVRDICERQQIPPRFLEQVFQDLRRAGLVRSKRGPRGGYQLACPPEEIRLGDVIRAVDGPIQLTHPNPPQEGDETPTSMQVTQHILSEVTRQVDACLDATTVADMCDAASQLGLHAKPSAPYVYSI